MVMAEFVQTTSSQVASQTPCDLFTGVLAAPPLHQSDSTCVSEPCTLLKSVLATVVAKSGLSPVFSTAFAFALVLALVLVLALRS